MAPVTVCTNIHDEGINDDNASVQHTSAANYLFRRLHELGARAVHGVEGEHNRHVLEYIEPAGMKWVEHYSELSAGYAADGYARIKGISVLITTFGSGELCALNAIAAANAEWIPIVHIVGMPSTCSAQNGNGVGGLFHPSTSVGSGGIHSAFADLHRPFSVVCAVLDNPAEIASQIDHTLRECWIHSRPVYIGLPSNMAHQPVECDRLQVPMDLYPSPSDPRKEKYVASVVLRYLSAASDPVILVDAGTIRHRSQEEVHDLITRSNMPTFVSPIAKGMVDESLPNYCGVYAGSASEPDVRERVESADLVLSIGALRPDFVNQSGLVYLTSGLPTIYLFSDRVCVRYSEYHGIRMKSLLSRIADELRPPSAANFPRPVMSPGFPPRNTSLQTHHDSITHLWFWRTLARWLHPQDTLLANADVPAFGLWGIRYACQVTSIIPTLWRSTGYGIPASQGAALAVSELATTTFPITASSPINSSTSSSSSSPTKTSLNPNPRYPRIILFLTPEELHESPSEISLLLRQKLKPIIIILSSSSGGSPQPKPSPATTTENPDIISLFPQPLKHTTTPKTNLLPPLKPRPKGFHLPGHAQTPLLLPAHHHQPDPFAGGHKSRCGRFLSALGAAHGDAACEFSGPVSTREQMMGLFNEGFLGDGGSSALRIVEVEFNVPGDEPEGLGRVRRAYSSSNRWTTRPGGG